MSPPPLLSKEHQELSSNRCFSARLASPFEYSEDVVIEKKIISVTSIGRNEATFQSQMPEPLQVKDQPGVSSAMPLYVEIKSILTGYLYCPAY